MDKVENVEKEKVETFDPSVLLKNIDFIIDSSYYPSESRSSSPTKKEIFRSMDMSYVTYSNLVHGLANKESGSYRPQNRTLVKFVKLFNQEYTPKIDLAVLKRTDLSLAVDSGVYSRKLHSRQELEWYSGCFFCYHYDAYGQICYGILNIYADQSDYYAQVLDGFSGEDDLDHFLNNLDSNQKYRKLNRGAKLLEFFRDPATVKERFQNYCTSYKMRSLNYRLYNGKVELYRYAFLLNLLPMDGSYKSIVVLKRWFSSGQQEYQGGLGSVLSLAYEVNSRLSNTLRYMGISRNYLSDTESIRQILSFQPSNRKILDLSANDSAWYRLITGQEIHLRSEIDP